MLWRDGRLFVVHETIAWQNHREILVFHRPSKAYTIPTSYPPDMVKEIEDDMLRFGYYLPDWTPVMTRHICMDTAMEGNADSLNVLSNYRPYKKSCFGKKDTDERIKFGNAALMKDSLPKRLIKYS